MSNLVEHAKRELELLGETDQAYVDSILKVMEAFAAYGHSDGSATNAIHVINELLQFHPLTPLTNDPAEWNEVANNIWQSRRNSEAFSTDQGKTYYLVSEMTPYYESDDAPVEKIVAPASVDTPFAAPQAPANPGDTIVGTTMVGETPPPVSQ